MKLFAILRSLNYKQLPKTLWLFLKRPQLLFIAFSATTKCMAICDTLYGNSHHRNNPANAFRHALWNILLIQKGMRWTKYRQTATEWAKIVSDWHEEFSPNAPLAKQMDLHNNAVGRDLANEFPGASEDQMIQKLLKLVTLLPSGEAGSRKCEHIDELANHTGFLVHIED